MHEETGKHDQNILHDARINVTTFDSDKVKSIAPSLEVSGSTDAISDLKHFLQESSSESQ